MHTDEEELQDYEEDEDVRILEHTKLSFSNVCKSFHVTVNVARTLP